MFPMNTLLKIEANRQNALASTGPQTAGGKAIVACNAIRHGLLSWKPVIPGLESSEDWENHLERTIESLAPVGHMETLLAERAALLFWRLGRVARYERDATTIGLDQIENRKRPKIDEAEQPVMDAKAAVTLAKRLQTLPPDTELDPDSAAMVLSNAADVRNVDIYEDEEMKWPNYVQDTLREVEWTAARLLECLQIVAQRSEITLDELLVGAKYGADDALNGAKQHRDTLLAELDRARRSSQLPDALTLAKVTRYETTLERSLFKTLHELERRQATRTGQTVPLPLAVDVNLSGPAQE
jgi:hypothetical protein